MKTSVSKQWLTLVVLLFLCATAASGQRQQRPAPSSPARLSAMKILPYDGMSDTFSDDMADSDQALFNDLDISLLVKVEVSGEAGEFVNRNVEITARQGNRLILNRIAGVGIFNENGKYYVTAWIYRPICQDTVVQARLLGQGRPAVIKKTISANCGE